MEPKIKAIETVYNGYRFRSRLEARWAVFFDTLGIKYEYEKEGYDLGELGWYLPDFWIPSLSCWIEIKGNSPGDEETWKAHQLAKITKNPVYIFYGEITVPEDEWGNQDSESSHKHFPDGEGWDSHYIWCECPICGKLGIEFDGRADRIKCECARSRHGDKGYNAASSRLIKAYTSARSARFENGENGRRGA